MHLLGVGRCSIVFALTPEEVREIAPDLAPEVSSHLALRISRMTVTDCPTCYSVLGNFAGFRHIVKLTSVWHDRCTTVYPSSELYCQMNSHAQLIANFAVPPCELMGYNLKRNARWFALELKPKAVWQQPRVVGIVVDGEHHYLHPVKLRQCRFSMMQLLKCERKGRKSATQSYCPNALLCGDVSTMTQALKRLSVDPANNFRLLASSDAASMGPIGMEWDAVSTALHYSGVLKSLTKLQLHGHAEEDEWGVLDIALLLRWSAAQDATAVQWIVPESSSVEVECGCKHMTKGLKLNTSTCTNVTSMDSKIHKMDHNFKHNNNNSVRCIAPPINLQECMDRFYAATTARDASLMVSLSAPEEERLTELVNSSLPFSFQCSSANGAGVLVDFGFPFASVCLVGVVDLDVKRHKSLLHYGELDKDIVGAWERWYSSEATTFVP